MDLPGVFADRVRLEQAVGNQVLGPLDGQKLRERLVQYVPSYVDVPLR